MPAARIERALHGAQQFGQRERLLDEVERAEPRRFHGGLDCSVAGHHDHGTARSRVGRPLAQQRDAIDIRHPDVEEHEVRRLPHACRASLDGVGGNVYLVTFLGKDLLQEAANVRLIVDDQDA
jgi:hypothetical protein